VFSDGDTPTGDQYGGGEIYTMNPDGSLITPVFQSETTINLFPEWPLDVCAYIVPAAIAASFDRLEHFIRPFC
jgi:hypothetical protein